MSDYYKKSETYTKAQIDALVDNSAGETRKLKSITTQPTGTFVYEAKVDLVQIGGEVDLSNYYTKTEIDERLAMVSDLLLRLFNNDLTVKELTISEIEKLLGYKVKIVKADSDA